ncbi:MAG: hypothetical protein JWO60_67 [Frankiales bacterium]|nr:hypothetical protein [Frankiales bacterium]
MDALGQVRALCLALPETAEAVGHGRPVFQVRGKTFVHVMDDHHGDGRLALWVKSTHEAQAEAVEAEPDRFFVPPYVGPSGWLGLRLDVDVDWEEVDGVLRAAWRLQAPKRLALPD